MQTYIPKSQGKTKFLFSKFDTTGRRGGGGGRSKPEMFTFSPISFSICSAEWFQHFAANNLAYTSSK